MPNYRVSFEDGKEYVILANDRESAAAKARKKYRQKNGKAGRIKRIRA